MPADSAAPVSLSPPEVLLTVSQAKDVLRTLSTAKIEALARASTVLSTADGPITDKSVATVLAGSTVEFASNKSWGLAVDGKQLELTFTVLPRSTWAFNNGPAGNFAQVGWKTGDKIPGGIEVEPRPAQGGQEDTWVKTTRSRTDLLLFWKVQLWKTQFLHPRTSEYAVSGRPVAWEAALEMHRCLDQRWELYASTKDDVVKKKASHGPTSTMYLSARRPVFVPNAYSMDEGRLSEYKDVYGLLDRLEDTDLRYNRIPEVLVYDSVTKKYSPISFHELHRLGAGLVMNVTVSPMGFTWGKGYQKQELGWEYRLINITVLGRREDDSLSSPSKLVVKRKIIDLDLDDSADERNPKKTTTAAKKSTQASGAEGSGGAQNAK